jgi:hypothetical protein
MKLAAQADYLIQFLGAEETCRRLNKIGYKHLVYQFDQRYAENKERGL